jgi:tRNA 2-thiouridine synthesizing protein E
MAKQRKVGSKGKKPRAKTKSKGLGKAKTRAKKRTAAKARRKPAQRTLAPPPSTGRQPPPTMYGIMHPEVQADADFRDAPEAWTPADAQALAVQAGLDLRDDHWEVIRVLQGCYKDEAHPRIRLLHDALEARFRDKGGMKYLYEILPAGPIAQGCALAGLRAPAGAKDLSYGSVA